MKRFIFLSIISLAIAASSFANINRTNPFGKDDPVEVVEVLEIDSACLVDTADSDVPVIAWFAKGDTAEYDINESRWNLSETDTLLVASATTHVRIVVTDSTAEGYKIDYTILGVDYADINDSPLAPPAARIAKQVSQKLVGTTIKIETDEFGAITRFANLDKIKKKSRTIIKEIMNGLKSMIDTKSMKQQGVDFDALIDGIDIDKTVEGFLKDPSLIFGPYGRIYTLGNFTDHEDASDTEFESTTTTSTWEDPETELLNISVNVDNIIPATEVKDLLSEFLKPAVTDDALMSAMNNEMDSAFTSPCIYNTYLHFKILPESFPMNIISQTNITIGPKSRSQQTVCTLTHFGYIE